jgi:glutamate synthase domain-containing protein 1
MIQGELGVKTIQEYHRDVLKTRGGKLKMTVCADNLFLPERPREACGIFAVHGHEDAAKLAYFGLYALQHRGQESAGIVTSDGMNVMEHKAMGLVPDIFREEILAKLKGRMALGHVRYSTTGSSLLVNAQPFRVQHLGKCLAIAHNGNLVNARRIRDALEGDGHLFQTTTDSEVVLHLAARAMKKGLEEAMRRYHEPDQGRLFDGDHDPGHPHCHARPPGVSPPLPGPPRLRLRGHL